MKAVFAAGLLLGASYGLRIWHVSCVRTRFKPENLRRIGLTSASKRIRVASDIGGTFTDIVLQTPDRLVTTKLLTTPRAPEQAVLEGVSTVLAQANLQFSDLEVFLHGTTLATNAIIERKGARTALIATEGFRDVLEIADESRYDQYDVFIEKPATVVPRSLRFTVPERVDVEGNILIALDEAAVVAVAQQLKALQVDAVAIAFIHSYVNPVHEQQVARIVREHCPELEITISSEVCPEAREYERTSTAVVNAYVQPLIAGYLQRLASGFAAKGYNKAIHLMTSGGNLASLETACRFPIRLVESGPAGGAILAAALASERDEQQILSFDMGGTTAKVCLIENGTPLKARSFEVDRTARFMKGSGLPVRIPVIEMIEIGAGGGSIARLDEMGRIQVGPQSAGSEPGPACYGRGGEQATVTDGDITLGKIDPARFAGGRIPIFADKAAVAIDAAIGVSSPTASGTNTAMSTETAAFGLVEIVDENMANAARVHAVERGVDLAGRTLIAFGGAAPLHASRLAEKLGIKRIIIPHGAGVGSAIGFLRAPAAYETVRSRYMLLESLDAPAVNNLLQEMATEAEQAARSAAGEEELFTERGAFMRYAGQGHEIHVMLPERALVSGDGSALRERFEAAYRALFNRQIPGAAIEIMSWSLSVSTARSESAALPQPTDGGLVPATTTRQVFDAALGKSVPTQIVDREQLSPGQRITGPAIVVEEGTSTLISSSFDATVDGGQALILTSKEQHS